MNSTAITPDIFHAVADPNRRTLLDLLLDGPRPVQELGTVHRGAVRKLPKPCFTPVDHLVDTKEAARPVNRFAAVADRTQPMNFEIHTITSVEGIRSESRDDVIFQPFYSADDFTAAGETQAAYFTQSRQMRRRSENQRLKGARTSYLGSEVYLSLVDRTQAPFAEDVEQLAVEALCTNRDLPLLFASGMGDTDFTLPGGGPVRAVRALAGPTRPQPSLAEGDAAWRLVSHLSLNYLSLIDQDRGEGASALRELLAIYAPIADAATNKQLEGLVSVSSRPIVRRLADKVLSTAVRGLEVTITFDESFYEGSGVYALGSVLERFLAKYVSLNSFTETVVRSSDRGEIARWPARSGVRRLI